MDVTKTQLRVRRKQRATVSLLHSSTQEHLLHRNISNSSNYPLERYTRAVRTHPPSPITRTGAAAGLECELMGLAAPRSFQQHWLPLQLPDREQYPTQLSSDMASAPDGTQAGSTKKCHKTTCVMYHVKRCQRTRFHSQSPSVQPMPCTWRAQSSKGTSCTLSSTEPVPLSPGQRVRLRGKHMESL